MSPRFPDSDARILVAMSGGVDSAVAAAMLVQEGYDVVGVTMRHFCTRKADGSDVAGKSCCSLEALEDARRVCERLDVPHHTLDVEDRFGRLVVEDFRAEYLRGRTPNPCVRCNGQVRFPSLLEMAETIGARQIATGHYARIEGPRGPGGTYGLRRGTDPEKDQSYFLWTLGQDVLARTRFPLGDLSKREVRERARECGLPVADKPDSQEICFVPEGDYRDFIDRPDDASPALMPGPVVDTDGRELGRHSGTALFTIGQRRGIGVAGSRAPLYVVEIRPEARTIVVGEREEMAAPGCRLESPNWIAGDPPKLPLLCTVRIRYRHSGVRARVEPGPGDGLTVRFEEPQEAVTPGQSAVFHVGDRVLGGGVIRRASRPTATAGSDRGKRDDARR